MNDLDKWAAEQCGVELNLVSSKALLWFGNTATGYQWTIQDPRCREIVREHFKIDTREYYQGGWQCAAEDIYPPIGQTIAEAEIACIKAIKEAMNE